MSFATLVDELAEGRPVRRSQLGGRRPYAVIAERWYLDVSERAGHRARGPCWRASRASRASAAPLVAWLDAQAPPR